MTLHLRDAIESGSLSDVVHVLDSGVVIVEEDEKLSFDLFSNHDIIFHQVMSDSTDQLLIFNAVSNARRRQAFRRNVCSFVSNSNKNGKGKRVV